MRTDAAGPRFLPSETRAQAPASARPTRIDFGLPKGFQRVGWGGRGWVHHERTRARAHTHTLSQTHISGFRSPGRLKTTHRASRARATAGLLRRRPPVASEGGGGERRRGRARPPSSSLPRRESPPPAGPPCSRAHCGVRQAATIANEEREEGIMREGRGDQERGKRGS